MKNLIRLSLLFVLMGAMVQETNAASLPAPAESQNSSSLPAREATASALHDYRSLSRSEKKSRMKEVKKAVRQFKADRRAGKTTDDQTLLLVILSILLPPLAVYLKEDEINTKFWIDLILTLIFWIPGVIYALLVVFDQI